MQPPPHPHGEAAGLAPGGSCARATDPLSTRTDAARGHLLVDRELAELVGVVLRAAPGCPPPTRAQVQPASVDLRLAGEAWRVRCGFLPGQVSIEERLAQLSTERLSLEGAGAVLEPGAVYLVPLAEELALPADLRARFNPRSSTGRCDVFTRVLCPGHARFDEAPPGFAGRPWLEIAPLSFPVRLARGDRLAQVRFARGAPRLSAAEVRALHAASPLAWLLEGGSERPLTQHELAVDADGWISLTVSLAGRDPVGWRALETDRVLEFARDGAHAAQDFFEQVHAPGGRLILEPSRFYVFASRERLAIPPEHAAEMQPVDVGIGELRNNYAGFFDNGFGWRGDDPAQAPGGTKAVLPAGGTPAVLEVRAHDVPFLVEDGQAFFRLALFATDGRPEQLYGRGRTSYRAQDLTLARCFRAPDTTGG